MELKRLANALDLFAQYEPTHLNLHFVQLFLAVAEHDGPCTFRHLETELGLTNSSVSRTVTALGKINRKGEPGLDVLETCPDPEEGRRNLVKLTAKGKALVRNLQKT